MPSFRMTGFYAGRQSKVTTGSTVHHGRPILDGALVLQRRAVGDGLFGLDAGRADTYQGVLYLALVDRSVHQFIADEAHHFPSTMKSSVNAISLTELGHALKCL